MRQAAASPSPQTCPLPESAIFVDPVNRTRNASCWNGGRENPCNSVSHSIWGGRETNRSVVLLPGSYRKLGYCVCDSLDTFADSACNSWFHLLNGTCMCGNDIHHTVKCDQKTGSVWLLACYCMTHDSNTGETVVGPCIYACLSQSIFRLVPQNSNDINDVICGRYRRTGRLCSNCKEGYRIPAYSYTTTCIECHYHPYNWILYILAAFGPLTVFYVIIFIFRVNIAAPPFTAFVQVCQTVACPSMVRFVDSIHIPSFMKCLLTLYGIWNLDFFRLFLPPICLPLSQLQVIAIDYLIACYPLFLVVITYLLLVVYDRKLTAVVWLTKPFCACLASQHQNLKSSTISTFASFLLLSYVKILNVSIDLLLPTKMYYMNGTSQWILSDLATVNYFGTEHLPYAILAVGITMLFTILPLLFLLLYPNHWFQQLLGYCHLHSHMLQMFTDAFQGCYKDGTNDTHGCRYFSAVYLILRILGYVVYALTNTVLFWTLTTLLFLGFTILVVILQPYKNSLYNKADSILLLMIGMFFLPTICMSSFEFSYIYIFFTLLLVFSSLSPLLWAVVMFFHWITVRKQYHRLVFERIKQFCLENRHRQSGPSGQGDIELHLIEPLMREEESQQ